MRRVRLYLANTSKAASPKTTTALRLSRIGMFPNCNCSFVDFRSRPMFPTPETTFPQIAAHVTVANRDYTFTVVVQFSIYKRAC
jgi:hypothetical protein